MTLLCILYMYTGGGVRTDGRLECQRLAGGGEDKGGMYFKCFLEGKTAQEKGYMDGCP